MDACPRLDARRGGVGRFDVAVDQLQPDYDVIFTGTFGAGAD